MELYPVSYKGEYHIRSGSTKQELKGAALDRFLLRKQGRTWDGVPVPQIAIRGLSTRAVASFRKRARQSRRLDEAILRESTPGLIEKLHLLDGKYLKRAAVLLFHNDPEAVVTGAFVKIGFFRTNAELLYHDEIHGDLFTQVERTMDILLTKYLKAGISYVGIQRIESLPVPEAALREAVLNAIIHKDYASGTPIQISVYQDKLMLWNPGELPPDWTVANLKRKHPSRPFNPDVANAFFRAGMIEAWGRGIERIIQACRAAGTPPPEFRYEPSGLWAEFAYQPSTATGAPVETPVEMSGKASGKMSGKILAHLLANPDATIPELARLLGITQRSIERYLRQLRQQNRVRRIGPAKGGHWIPVTTQETAQDRIGEKLTATGEVLPITTQETTQEKILALLRAQPSLTHKALSQRIGISANGIKYHLAKLREAGVIRHVGPTKAGRWEVLK
jgi:ATP-dependent DNA helicase RecG